jgi:F-type H+-transporting ATPase subunit b
VKGRAVLQILPDLTLAIQIVLFLLFIWVMNALLFRPTLQVLEDRQERIEWSRKRASELQARIEEAVAKYSGQVREARMNGERERARLVQEASVEEERVASEGRDRAARTTAEIRDRIAREAEVARGELEGRAREFGALIAEQVLGRRVA